MEEIVKQLGDQAPEFEDPEEDVGDGTLFLFFITLTMTDGFLERSHTEPHLQLQLHDI